MSERAIPSLKLSSERIIRRKQLLAKLSISNATMYGWLNPKSDYFKKDFPRAIYFPGSRIPYWNEAEVDRYIKECVVPQESKVQDAPGAAHNTAHLTAPKHALPRKTIGIIHQAGADGSVRAIEVEMRRRPSFFRSVAN